MKKNVGDSSLQLGREQIEEVPKEWEMLNSRVSEVERHIIILESRSVKLEKKFNLHAQEVTEMQVELAAEIKELKDQHIDGNMIENQIKEAIVQFQSLNNHTLEEQIEKIVLRQVPSIDKYTGLLEQKLKVSFENNKLYIDRAVHELKEMLKKYVQDQAAIEKKLQSSTHFQRSPNNSQKKKHPLACSNSNRMYSTESLKKSEVRSENSFKDGTTGSSRVNYLREKLKQFEKINKKYETPNEKKISTAAVQKMKNYHFFLQQSQSQIEPSNMYIGEEKESIWRKQEQR